MNLNDEYLATLTIYKLRDCARDMGVKAPTTKKRDELIEEMKLIEAGRLEPFFPQKKIGRPAKSQYAYHNNDELADVKNIDLSINKEVYDKEFVVEGYVCINNANEFLVYNYGNDITLRPVAWIPKQVVDKKRVKEGDFINIKAKKSTEHNLAVCTSIFEVNDQTYKGLRRENYNTKPLCDEKVPYLLLGNTRVCFSDRILFSGNSCSRTSHIAKLLNEFYDYRQGIVFLDLNCTKERFYRLKKFNNLKIFCCSADDTFEAKNACKKLAVEHCKRMAELGKRAVLAVADIDKLLNDLDAEKKLETANSFFEIARNFDIGSLTVVATICQQFFEDNIYLETLIDNHISLIENISYQ